MLLSGIVNTAQLTCQSKSECLIRSCSSAMYWMLWSIDHRRLRRKGF